MHSLYYIHTYINKYIMYVHMTHINIGTHLIIEYVHTYIQMFTGMYIYTDINTYM